MPYPFSVMVLYFFIYSFLGWLLETLLCSFQERRFINRGFLNGPFCPIYGCAVSLMLILLIPVRDSLDNTVIAVLVIFFSCAVLATVTEYFISWIMEKLFKARWWDYSHIKFNINGRVNVIISVIWGGLATLLLYCLQPLLDKLAALIFSAGSTALIVVDAVLIAFLIFDAAISYIVARRIGNKLEQLDKWNELIHGFVESIELPTKEDILRHIERLAEKYNLRKAFEKRNSPDMPELHTLTLDSLRRRIADYANEIRAKSVKLMTSTRYLQKRMLRAFPYMKWPRRPAILRDWKEHLSSKHKPTENKEESSENN